MRLLFLLACACACAVHAADTVVISNDKIEVTILKLGASITSVVLKSDKTKLNPLWQPEQHNFGGYGHFVCVDGFGGTSPEEKKAGLPGHGEAIHTMFDVVGPEVVGGVTTVTLSATLPLVQERIIRMYALRPGQSVVIVRTRLESQVGFDRPISWAEHATIGSPFLERGVTAVDKSSARSRTRPYELNDRSPQTLSSGTDFTWPNAPMRSGSSRDLRTAPASGPSMDHVTTALDRTAEWAWATAVNPTIGRIVGWLWRPSDFPWLQDWQNYPDKGVLARGLEFSTQPWDIPRREAVAINTMLGNPAFRWLPAKSAIETTFMLFYADVPHDLDRVSSVKFGGGNILLNDRIRIAAPETLQ